MKFISLAPLATLAMAASAYGQSLMINTPTNGVLTCVPTLLTWSGGVPPYYVNVNQGGSSSQILQQLVGPTNATSYTWIPTLPVGTSITLAIRDSTGATNFGGQVTIQMGTSTTCSTSSASGSATSTGGASSTSSMSMTSTSSTSTSTTMSSTSTTMSSATSTSLPSLTTSAAPAATTSARPNGAVGSQAAKGGAAALAVIAAAAALL